MTVVDICSLTIQKTDKGYEIYDSMSGRARTCSNEETLRAAMESMLENALEEVEK